MDHEKRRKQARTIRVFRKIHRITGIFLFVFFFLIGFSGLLLGWKKNSGGYILAPSYLGTLPGLSKALPLDSLNGKALFYAATLFGKDKEHLIERIDVRPDKGMAKFIFKEKYNALQLDLSTGNLLHAEKRRADLIEHLHDGSMVDKLLLNDAGWFKLLYTTIMGLSLITFSITGFWLWYGPKRMNR
ncbi:MAG TPA: PepSY domain-containing protein [Cyclobacteriaceae bacterium]|nr:PepSY domain-containing protein [Cyclobacteriaceae bacterium]